jgi:hypothetical protein
MEGSQSRSFVDRVIGAALLDAQAYEEVEADENATAQAALVVGLSALASAIGGAAAGPTGFFGGLFGAFIAWLAWSGITWLIGDKLLGGNATWGELLRTIGFAQAPGMLAVLGVVPLLGGLVRLAVFGWLLVAGIVAIRQALDFTTGRAIATALLGWLAMLLLVVPFL